MSSRRAAKKAAQRRTNIQNQNISSINNAVVKESPKSEEKVYVQYQSIEADVEEVKKEVRKSYVQAGNNEADIKDIKIYIKPEDGCAYYVINGDYTGKVNL